MDFTDHNIILIVGLQALQEFLRACRDAEAGLESRPLHVIIKDKEGLAHLCTHPRIGTASTVYICCAYINADQGKIFNPSQSPCPRI
jgi:hypothetical protein